MGAETERMRRLVEDLLLLAKADDEGLRMRHTDVDLDDLVEAEVRRLRSGSGPGRSGRRRAPRAGVR